MSGEAPWFSEHQEIATRWLGLLPRQPRLLLDAARSSGPASLRVATAQHLSAALLEPPAARTIAQVELREERRQRGSASLEGLAAFEPPLAEAQPGRDDWQGVRGEGPGDAAEHYRKDLSPEQAMARLLAAVLQPPLDLLLAGEGPMEWPHPLLPYQIDGIRTLVERPALLLADDMGLGKTVQAIAALRILVRQRQINSALAVVPAGLLSQWRAELERWAPELRVVTVHGDARERGWHWRAPAHLHLTTYETLRADSSDNPRSPLNRQWDLVLLDEAQRIKNADTDISRACKRLRRARQWALSGTPLENSIDDLDSLLQFVDPQPPHAGWHMIGRSELKEQLSRVQLRRRKADVLQDLPPKLVSTVVLPLSAAQRASYDRAEQEGIVALRNLGEEVRVQNVLELITRLKQICNVDPATGRSSKLDDLRERVRTLAEEGHRALIFTQFANQESGARAIAARLGVPALFYTGDLSQGSRNAVIERFRSDETQKALVLALRAGGQGLNLQQASYVFHFDRWWNPAVEQQAEARSHRIGQHQPVNVYSYACEGTIEERIDRVLAEKQLLFDEIVDGVSIDPVARFTSDDLFSLFDLRPPAAMERDPAPRGAGYAGLDGPAFERHVANLLERHDWQVRTAPPGPDGGIDLIAARLDALGVESTLYLQCKNQAAPVGVGVVRELNGAMRQRPGARGVIVSPSGLTADAAAFAREREILVWDRAMLELLERDAPQAG